MADEGATPASTLASLPPCDCIPAQSTSPSACSQLGRAHPALGEATIPSGHRDLAHTKDNELHADLPVGGTAFIRDHARVHPRVLPGHGVEGDASVREGDSVLKGSCGERSQRRGAGELEEAGARDTKAPKQGGGKALGTWHPDAGLTCDLVVIADEAGDVTLGKLPLHSGRGEARVGAGQLGGYRQDQCEWEEASTNREDRTRAGSPPTSSSQLTFILGNFDLGVGSVHGSPAQRQQA